jgi:glycosyltransferase involved in cell wall biosynthesis
MNASKRIHIAQLIHTFDIEYGGGLTRFAIQLGKRLNPDIFKVTFFSMGKKDQNGHTRSIQQLRQEGHDVMVATNWIEGQPFRNLVLATQSLKSRFTQDPVDLVHSHSQYTDLAVTFLKLQSTIPIAVRTVHYGYPQEWRNRAWMRAIFTNFLFPFVFDQEIGINQVNTDRLNRRWLTRLLKREAIKIYNAIDIQAITQRTMEPTALKAELGISGEARVVGTIGRLEEQKGYIHLLHATHQLRNDQPKIYVLIIGNGPLRDDLAHLAGELGIADQVIFTGNRPDISNLLNCMDVFVSTSLWEGLPTVLLECMANQVPIIATDIPGTNELIDHGFNGWLVQPASAESLVQGIRHLLSTPDIGVKISAQGTDTVKNFSIDVIAREHERIYLHNYRKLELL